MIRQDVKFYGDKVVDGVEGWWWYIGDHGAWEGPNTDWENHHKPNILDLCDEFRVAVQMGGNLGMYPRLLSNHFQRVYTWEPDPINFYILNLNCPQENVYKTQSAVGDFSGMISIARPTMNNLGMHHVVIGQNSTIPQVTLNHYDLKDVDLLMIDVEGYESHVIRGASQLLESNNPIIFIERPTEEVVVLLKQHGYNFVRMSSMDGVFAR